jgi:hypothetical protein
MKKIFKNKVAIFALAVLAIVAAFVVFSNPVIGGAFLCTFPLIVKVGNKDFTVKSQEEKDQMDQLLLLMNAITDKAINGLITVEEATKKIEEKIAEKGFKLENDVKFKEYTEAVIKQGLEITALKEKAGDLTGKSIYQQISEQITADKAGWDDFITKKSQKFNFQLSLKAGTMRPSTNAGAGTIPYQFQPGLTDIASPKVFLMDLIGVKQTSSPTIYWTNKTNRDGTVGFIADTGTLTQIDFDLTAETSTAKNVGDYIKIHENMLNDIPYITSEIQKELIYQVDDICDKEVLSGSGLTVHLKGITVCAATGFSLTTLSFVQPNTYDCILAAATQIEAANFMPNVVLLNPIDFTNMIGSKSDTGIYVMPPFATQNGQVAGLTVYKSNRITAGEIIVMDSTKCNLFELGNMTVEAGFEGSDFKDMTRTFRAYRRLHFYISDNNTAAFVYDTIDDIKAAITAL